MSTLDDILADALMLPNEVRAELAHQIIKSLPSDCPTSELHQEWGAEIERRLAEFDSNPAASRDFDDSIAEIKEALRSRKSPSKYEFSSSHIKKLTRLLHGTKTAKQALASHFWLNWRELKHSSLTRRRGLHAWRVIAARGTCGEHFLTVFRSCSCMRFRTIKS